MRASRLPLVVLVALTAGCIGEILETYPQNLKVATTANSYVVQSQPLFGLTGGTAYTVSVVTVISNLSTETLATFRCTESEVAPVNWLMRDDGQIGIFGRNRACVSLPGPSIAGGEQRVDTLVLKDSVLCCSSITPRIGGNYRLVYQIGDFTVPSNTFRLNYSN